MKTLIVLGMIVIFVYNIFPALLSRDQVKIQQACDRTSQQIIQYTTDRIVDEVNVLPLEIAIDHLSK